MKGQTGIELGILAMMGLIGVIAIYVPPILYKTSATINMQYEYNYDNSQLLMTSLLSTTVTDSIDNIAKPSMEVLGEYLQMENKPDMSGVGNKLKLLTGASNLECYKLSTQSGDIVKSSCDPSKYKVSATIPLPYKPDNFVKEINLVVGK